MKTILAILAAIALLAFPLSAKARAQVKLFAISVENDLSVPIDAIYVEDASVTRTADEEGELDDTPSLLPYPGGEIKPGQTKLVTFSCPGSQKLHSEEYPLRCSASSCHFDVMVAHKGDEWTIDDLNFCKNLYLTVNKSNIH
jgi:hypothetical protein